MTDAPSVPFETWMQSYEAIVNPQWASIAQTGDAKTIERLRECFAGGMSPDEAWEQEWQFAAWMQDYEAIVDPLYDGEDWAEIARTYHAKTIKRLREYFAGRMSPDQAWEKEWP